MQTRFLNGVDGEAKKLVSVLLSSFAQVLCDLCITLGQSQRMSVQNVLTM